jgi:hypothetical protein
VPISARVATVCTVALSLSLGPALAAEAHPLGNPQTLELSLGAPDIVSVTWRVGAADDISWLALDLGLLPPDRVLLDGALTPEDSDAELLEASPSFDAYLIEHIVVNSAGADCAGTVISTSDIVNDGVVLDYVCSAPVTDARIAVSLLTDLDPAYTTVASTADGQTASYDGQSTVYDWTFDPAAAPSGAEAAAAPADNWPWPLTLGVVAVIAAPALAGALVWSRRRPRAATSPRTPTTAHTQES